MPCARPVVLRLLGGAGAAAALKVWTLGQKTGLVQFSYAGGREPQPPAATVVNICSLLSGFACK